MKTAKFSRILSVLALLLVATMLLTLVSCGSDEPAEDIPAVEGGDTSTEPSDENATDPSGEASETEAPETETSETDPSATESSASKTTASKSGLGKTSKTSKTASTSKTSKTTKPTVSDDENVLNNVPDSLSGTSIKMYIWWTSGKDDKAEAATFEKATGIKVTYETTTLAKYQTNLSSKVMAQNAPTLAAMINEWYPTPITRNLMQPLDSIEGWNFKDSSVYALSLMDQFGYKGKHYGIALKGSNMTTFEVMFFNKSILAKQGVKIGTDDPYTLWKKGQWNWDTCLSIAQKCTDASKKLSGISNVYQNYWMLSAGQDFVLSTKAGLKSNVKNSKVLDAWNWNWDLVNTYKVIDTSYTGQTPFYQGKAAMLGGGSYFMQAEGTNYVPKNMKDDWSVVPFPSPKGNTVAACEGTVWGFPRGVTGNKLQAGAWYLRYFLDDYNYSDRSFYPKDECWEVMKWMWDQTIQSFNSVGVLSYGGEYTAASIQYSLLDEADTKAKLKSNLESWAGVLEANINKIEKELG